MTDTGTPATSGKQTWFEVAQSVVRALPLMLISPAPAGRLRQAPGVLASPSIPSRAGRHSPMGGMRS